VGVGRVGLGLLAAALAGACASSSRPHVNASAPPAGTVVPVLPRRAPEVRVAETRVAMDPVELRDSTSPVRSVRLAHPSAAAREAVARWLEPQVTRALAAPRCSFECTPGLATRELVSVQCVRFCEWEPDTSKPAGEQGGSTEPERFAHTWQVDGANVRVVTLRDVVSDPRGVAVDADGVSVGAEGELSSCTGAATCDDVEASPAFRAFVRRLLE
jgi:hypothetical protein